jgi:general secretion pathway protein G
LTLRRSKARGFSLVELCIVIFLMAIFAGIALPVAHTMERRAREMELKKSLREMRRALDSYNHIVQVVPSAKEDATDANWPEELEVLVEGLDLGLAKEVRVKFLRRIPVDPLTGEAEWGKRSSKQDADDDMWDGDHVFDVFSLAEGEALDGSEYKEW